MPPYIRMFGLCLYFYIQLVAFLVRANQHVNNQCDCNNCNNQTEYIYITSEQLAQLIYNQCNDICETAFITNCKPEPLCTVISRLIAPIAAKHGAHSRLNTRKDIPDTAVNAAAMLA